MGFATVALMVIVILLACAVCRWSPRAAYSLIQHGEHFFEPEPGEGPTLVGAKVARATEKTSERHGRGYLSPFLKKQIAYDQGWKCSCGCGRSLQPDFHIDHTMPLWRGGTDTTDNMSAMNPTCHARKTAIENQSRS